MKYVLLIIIIVVGYFGFERHKDMEKSIKVSVSEMFKKNNYRGLSVNGINLPLTFTFLSQKVESEVFYSKGSKSGSVIVDITPIEGLPIISIFSDINYQTSIPSSQIWELSKFK